MPKRAVLGGLAALAMGLPGAGSAVASEAHVETSFTRSGKPDVSWLWVDALVGTGTLKPLDSLPNVLPWPLIEPLNVKVVVTADRSSATVTDNRLLVLPLGTRGCTYTQLLRSATCAAAPAGVFFQASVTGGLLGDRVTGRGVDAVWTQAGDDWIDVRDGRQTHVVDCGPGHDVAIADGNDILFNNCETQHRG